MFHNLILVALQDFMHLSILLELYIKKTVLLLDNLKISGNKEKNEIQKSLVKLSYLK